MLAGIPSAFAQQQQQQEQPFVGLSEVVVTAQKRQENLQDVPISVQVLDTTALNELNVSSFEDYAKYLPSVSYQTFGPGFSRIIIRGVSSDYTRYPSGALPTVGTYVDEQPVTSISGTLDVHVYDIARVEALAGPQGTLYGASSEAGTLRIITNQPDPTKFSAAYEVEGNAVDHGDPGYVVQGYANMPLSPTVAVRLVGWSEHDGGYINNVPGTRTYPSTGICIANTSPAPAGCTSTPELAQKHYNDVNINGGRAAVKIDLNDSWTITPHIMMQESRANGSFGADLAIGPLDVTHFYPEQTIDRWVDAALTIEGKISNFDVVYAGGHLNRHVTTLSDYTDYALAYDQDFSSVIRNSAGTLINPSQQQVIDTVGTDWTNEIRVSTPKDEPLRAVVGAFVQHQELDITFQQKITSLAPSLSVTGWPGTWWLVDGPTVAQNSAEFGEVSWDVMSKLTATAGIRFFNVRSTSSGFAGYGLGVDQLFGIATGEAGCFAAGVMGAPCTNVNTRYSESGNTPKLSLSYKIDEHRLVYSTWAKGFRPGGASISGVPYKADYLTNYEVGWKTTWAGDRVRFNGAVFQEDWKDFQFSFTGANGAVVIANAGQAQVKGVETDVSWAATNALTLSGNVSLLNPILTENYCGTLDANGNPITNCAAPLAPRGTQLTGASKFKGDAIARYVFQVSGVDAHVQGDISYQSSTWPDLRTYQRSILGEQSPFALTDVSAGVVLGHFTWDLFVNNVFDRRAQLSRYALCAVAACGPIAAYAVMAQPLTVGLKFGQKF